MYRLIKTEWAFVGRLFWHNTGFTPQEHKFGIYELIYSVQTRFSFHTSYS